MITHCTECDTYFRVSVEQLKTANGQVKCGCCGTVFNAVESLLESTSDLLNYEGTSIAVGQGVLSDIPDDGNEDVETDEDELEAELEQENHQSRANEEELDVDQPDEEIPDQVDIVNDGEDSFSEPLVEDIDEYDHDLFEELIGQETEQETAAAQSNSAWFITSFLLAILLAFQVIKYNTEYLLAQFPEMQFLCKIAECSEPTAINDTSAINLISRDVREHPQFKDVLLVNATLMNSADDYQPFPRLQLDLFDSEGKAVGSREFAPSEYLDSSVDLNLGMKPRLPVHIVLEVMGSGEDTNSFEFKFL